MSKTKSAVRQAGLNAKDTATCSTTGYVRINQKNMTNLYNSTSWKCTWERRYLHSILPPTTTSKISGNHLESSIDFKHYTSNDGKAPDFKHYSLSYLHTQAYQRESAVIDHTLHLLTNHRFGIRRKREKTAFIYVRTLQFLCTCCTLISFKKESQLVRDYRRAITRLQVFASYMNNLGNWGIQTI